MKYFYTLIIYLDLSKYFKACSTSADNNSLVSLVQKHYVSKNNKNEIDEDLTLNNIGNLIQEMIGVNSISHALNKAVRD